MNGKSDMGIILKNLRKKKGYGVKEVSALLQSEYGIGLKFKSIYSYEAGRTFPDVDVFLALCMLYGCYDILHAFGYTDKRNSFAPAAPEDALIIQKYHSLPAGGQSVILNALGIGSEGRKTGT